MHYFILIFFNVPRPLQRRLIANNAMRSSPCWSKRLRKWSSQEREKSRDFPRRNRANFRHPFWSLSEGSSVKSRAQGHTICNYRPDTCMMACYAPTLTLLGMLTNSKGHLFKVHSKRVTNICNRMPHYCNLIQTQNTNATGFQIKCWKKCWQSPPGSIR